jgi:hypothetical protein
VPIDEILAKVSAVKREIKSAVAGIFKDFRYWTNSKVSYLTVQQPVYLNVKNANFDFLSFNQPELMTILLDIVCSAQNIAYCVFPEGNLP